MFRMHSAFYLVPGTDLPEFRAAWEALAADLIARDLLVEASRIAERRSDTPLDTDAERAHRYFAVMSFRDRAQSEAAWAVIAPHREPTATLHKAVLSLVADPIFTCWEDVAP